MDTKTKNETVVEWAPFILAEGVSEARFLEASKELQTRFLARQRGFVRRELLRGKDRQWVDLIYWANQESADAAIQVAMNSSACLAYFKLMVGVDGADAGAGVLHFKRVEAYEA